MGWEWARNLSCPSTTPVFTAPLLERRICWPGGRKRGGPFGTKWGLVWLLEVGGGGGRGGGLWALSFCCPLLIFWGLGWMGQVVKEGEEERLGGIETKGGVWGMSETQKDNVV